MLVARVIQGGGGAIFPLAFSIVRDEFEERVAGAIGMLRRDRRGRGRRDRALGAVVDNLSIHWLFWIPAIMTGVALVATYLWVPESPITAPGCINAPAVLTLSLARLPPARGRRGRRLGLALGARARPLRGCRGALRSLVDPGAIAPAEAGLAIGERLS